MKKEETITIQECMKRMGKTSTFIKAAIKNGSFPGSYSTSPGGRDNFHIPREAFEDYMSHYHRSPSDELIQVLIEKYMQSIQRKKAPAPTGTK